MSDTNLVTMLHAARFEALNRLRAIDDCLAAFGEKPGPVNVPTTPSKLAEARYGHGNGSRLRVLRENRCKPRKPRGRPKGSSRRDAIRRAIAELADADGEFPLSRVTGKLCGSTGVPYATVSSTICVLTKAGELTKTGRPGWYRITDKFQRPSSSTAAAPKPSRGRQPAGPAPSAKEKAYNALREEMHIAPKPTVDDLQPGRQDREG